MERRWNGTNSYDQTIENTTWLLEVQVLVASVTVVIL
jgi:hypothetical protein